MEIKQTTIIGIILGLLIVISAVQGMQLNNLQKIMGGENHNTFSTTKTTTPLAADNRNGNVGALPSSIKDLPEMVGGC